MLAQQRAEQQRRELAQNASSDTPMDPVTFIQTLPSDLRRSVLEDMEDSVLAVMPPDIAAEAQALRREQEARQRQLMHERLFGHSSTSALSAILRSPGTEGRKWEGSAISWPCFILINLFLLPAVLLEPSFFSPNSVSFLFSCSFYQSPEWQPWGPVYSPCCTEGWNLPDGG